MRLTSPPGPSGERLFRDRFSAREASIFAALASNFSWAGISALPFRRTRPRRLSSVISDLARWVNLSRLRQSSFKVPLHSREASAGTLLSSMWTNAAMMEWAGWINRAMGRRLSLTHRASAGDSSLVRTRGLSTFSTALIPPSSWLDGPGRALSRRFFAEFNARVSG
jgi:hypothetical protein